MASFKWKYLLYNFYEGKVAVDVGLLPGESSRRCLRSIRCIFRQSLSSSEDTPFRLIIRRTINLLENSILQYLWIINLFNAKLWTCSLKFSKTILYLEVKYFSSGAKFYGFFSLNKTKFSVDMNNVFLVKCGVELFDYVFIGVKRLRYVDLVLCIQICSV